MRGLWLASGRLKGNGGLQKNAAQIFALAYRWWVIIAFDCYDKVNLCLK